jgi:TolA-binding protein
VREQAAGFKKYGEQYSAHWTPTLLELDSEGVEQHRVEGFLEADDLLGQLTLGLGKAAFKHRDWQEAERRFQEVVERYPATDAAPEALYWAGVSRYRRTNDAAALGATSEAFGKRYQDSIWAKKASIWKH